MNCISLQIVCLIFTGVYGIYREDLYRVRCLGEIKSISIFILILSKCLYLSMQP